MKNHQVVSPIDRAPSGKRRQLGLWLLLTGVLLLFLAACGGGEDEPADEPQAEPAAADVEEEAAAPEDVVEEAAVDAEPTAVPAVAETEVEAPEPTAEPTAEPAVGSAGGLRLPAPAAATPNSAPVRPVT